MAVDVRRPTAEELRGAMDASVDASADTFEDVDFERESAAVRLERAVAAFDSGRPVGFAASYEFELMIPGASVPTAGVTWVGVLPTHRRQGIMRRLIEQLLDDARAHGEPLAALWASEAPIYGRFGFGLASHAVELDAESARIAFRDDPGPEGAVRLVDAEEAFALFPPIYERVRKDRPGMLSRSDQWWRRHRLEDYEHARRGASKRFNAVLEVGGEPAAYAIYRVKSDWSDGYGTGQVRVVEVFATSAAATREIWRFLFGVDLTTRVRSDLFDPASPLVLLVVDPRALHLSVRDGLWLRLVDVEAALRSRAYASADTLVLEVRDELCPWNAGRWRVGLEVERTGEDVDLALDIADLASAYLGAFDFHALAAAGRVDARRDGAVERASALFRTPRPPFCPEVF